jgi:hypothetical protein
MDTIDVVNPLTIEPLKRLMEVSKDKKDTLLYYVPPSIKELIYEMDYEESDFYISDRVYLISKQTFEMEACGRIISIEDSKLAIKKNSSTTLYIDPNEYYVFIKPPKKVITQRKLLESLMETLEKV